MKLWSSKLSGVSDGGARIPASKQSGTSLLEGLLCSPVVIGEVESVEGTAACERWMERRAKKMRSLGVLIWWSLHRLVVKARGMTMRFEE